MSSKPSLSHFLFALPLLLILWAGVVACGGTGQSTPPAADSLSANDPLPAPTDTFSLDYLMGRFDPAAHPDFVRIAPEHCDKPDMYLRRDAYEAFVRMYEAARADGIRLIIRSATRPFAHQKRIWEAKWRGERLVDGMNLAEAIPDPVQRALKILEYSSMPGTSRHHWGTDIDLNAFENSYFENGEGKQIYDWLVAHAHEYGFCQPYTPKGPDRPWGYNEEKWHWSYRPVAARLVALARQRLTDDMISGFEGSETAPAIRVVERYVLGINKACF